jgi:hypothetical protein
MRGDKAAIAIGGLKDRTAVLGDGYARSVVVPQDRSLVIGAVDRNRGLVP